MEEEKEVCDLFAFDGMVAAAAAKQKLQDGSTVFTGLFRVLQSALYQANYQWWHDPKTGEKLNRNSGELLMLMVSEIAEGMEGVRKGLNDDHLPNRRMIEVELADAVIRILDFAEANNLDIGGALVEKALYNLNREDHKIQNRLKDGGKKF